MDFSDKRVVVMGLGRFGGGVGVARYLVRCGANVLVTDRQPKDELHDSIAQLKGLPIDYRLGEHNVSDFSTADLIVANPAVPPDDRFLRTARAANVPITSEIRLLIEQLPNRQRTCGITGSAGKSTTAAMIEHVLKKTGHRVWLGGNIGGSLLDHLDDIQHDDWVVLELSSFMLEGLREAQWSPHIAVVTNIMPNHLDWHGSMENYVAAKQVIYDFQHEADHDIALAGPNVHNVLLNRVSVFSDLGDRCTTPPIQLLLPGDHNQLNARLASVAIEHALGLPEPQSWTALADFPGLPHRLQFITETKGIRCYNDSKSTTPEAAKLAIAAFDPDTVHIILGGYDKGSDLTDLAHFAEQCCAGIYTIGQTGPHLHQRIPTSIHAGDLVAAVAEAFKHASPSQVILLSPGCASWDQFTNFEQRGNQFIQQVTR